MANQFIQGAKNALIKAKKKVVDVASDVGSMVARGKADAAEANASESVNARKTVRAAKGVQDEGNYEDPLFRARATVAAQDVDVKQKQKEAMKKAIKPK